MRKYYFLLVIMLFAGIFSVKSQTVFSEYLPKNNWESYGLQGHVKSIKQTMLTVNQDLPLSINSLYCYQPCIGFPFSMIRNQVFTSVEFFENGLLKMIDLNNHVYKFEYGTDENITKMSFFSPVFPSEEYLFKNDSLIITSCKGGRVVGICKCKMSNLRIEKAESYKINKKGAVNLNETAIFKYDERGNLTAYQTYIKGKATKDFIKNEYFYDSNGQIIGMNTETKEVNTISTYSYKNKKIFKENVTYKMKYFVAMLLDGTAVPALYDGGTLEKTYAYTDKGHLQSISTIFRSSKKDLNAEFHRIEKKYEYDTHSNWIKCEIYYDGVLNDTFLREIEYWE